MTQSWQERCRRMVDEQIASRGVTDPPIVEAMRSVPRHLFVPSHLEPEAYEDSPLPIGEGQTISQPYIVALMIQYAEVKPEDIVLEIGTGSGYAAAVLSRIAQTVYTVERLPSLAEKARAQFAALGYQNIETKIDDGSLGWPEKGPFDAIIVTAASPQIPPALVEQLKPEGRLVIPMGDQWMQQLFVIRTEGKGFRKEAKDLVRFVPLLGKQGWTS